MATTGGTVPTLVDVLKSTAPDGTLLRVAELLNQATPINQDIEWLPANGDLYHRTALRTSLPTAYKTRFNEGVLPSKATTGEVEEAMQMVESLSEVDTRLLEVNNNSASWLNSQEDPHKMSLGIQIATDIFYANRATDPKSITGLSTRYSDVNLGESTGAAKDGAVVDFGGSGSDNCSIWLLGHGPNTFHGIYPKGSQAGLQIEDRGKETTSDANGGRYVVVRKFFRWKAGIAIPDWRAVIRGANIDTSNLITESSAADVVKGMIRMLGRRPADLIPMARWAFYVPQAVATMLEIQALSKAAYTISLQNFDGREIPSFRGVPINIVDQLLTTEAQLT
jgi:hypothetical protein